MGVQLLTSLKVMKHVDRVMKKAYERHKCWSSGIIPEEHGEVMFQGVTLLQCGIFMACISSFDMALSTRIRTSCDSCKGYW